MNRLLIGFAIVSIAIIAIASINRSRIDHRSIEIETADEVAPPGNADRDNQKNRPSRTSPTEQNAVNQEGIRLLAEAQKAGNDNDAERFRIALRSILSRRYEGDPKPLLNQLTPHLRNKNKYIRFELAKTFIRMGIEQQRARDTLLAFVNDENETPEEEHIQNVPGESYTVNLRESAANFLTTYRVRETIDPLWKAYEETENRSFLRNLAALGDSRAGKVALELVRANKATYSDFHNLFGSLKIHEAAPPLEAIYQARSQRYPSKNMTDLAWTLYQLTQNDDYYTYLLGQKFYLVNPKFSPPDVVQILENTLRDDDGTDINADGTRAFLSLLAREDGRESVENYLVDLFTENLESPLDAKLTYQVAAHLDSEKVNTAAQRYEDKYKNGLWPYYSYRKGWPVNELIFDHIPD